MANIAIAFKQEMSRIARKELRAETASLKKALFSSRSEIAALKRRAQALEQQLRQFSKTAPQVSAPARDGNAKSRFSAKGLISQRKRLGLSAEGLGLLLGTSGQTIYNWESGKARPHDSHLTAIAALKTLGKKDAAAHVAARAPT